MCREQLGVSRRLGAHDPCTEGLRLSELDLYIQLDTDSGRGGVPCGVLCNGHRTLSRALWVVLSASSMRIVCG